MRGHEWAPCWKAQGKKKKNEESGIEADPIYYDCKKL